MVQFGPFNPPAPAAKEPPRQQHVRQTQPRSRRARKAARASGQGVFFGAAMTGAMLVCGSYYWLFLSGRADSIASSAAAASRSPTIGKIIVTEGDQCIKKEYDNITGALKVAGDRTCDTPNPLGAGGSPQYHVPDNRLEMVRKGFLRQQQ
jgi:hypothetical protein